MEKMHNEEILLICGPTGSGKSKFAMELAATNNNIAIVNIDAYQVYKDIPICSASPLEIEKQEIPHYLYNYINNNERYSVGKYLMDLNVTLKNLIKNNKTPILVGGSSLYIYSLLNGINTCESVPDAIRLQAKIEFEKDPENFYNKIISLMPEISNKIHPNDTHRLIRNYEFFLYKKKSTLNGDFHANQFKLNFKFKIHKILPDREELYKKSDSKVISMIENGAIEEVKKLLPIWEQCKSIKTTLLVKEIYEYLTNKLTIDAAILEAQQNTRRFIKKQYCWLKNKIK